MKNNKKKNVLAGLLLLSALFMVILISGCSKDGTARNPASSLGAAGDGLVRGEGETETEADIVAGSLVPIVNLSVQASRMHIGDELSLVANAVDPSGGALEYEWSASAGVFVSAGEGHALWQAPAYSTVVQLSCKVTGLRGRVGSATMEVEVFGRTNLTVRLLGSTSSLFVSSNGAVIGGYAPLSGARVSIEGTDIYELSDTNGVANLSLSPEVMGVQGVVRVTYKNWDLAYDTLFPLRDGDHRADELYFAPGYDGVTVARGDGDSFISTYGMVEVRPVESQTETLKSVQGVTVSVGASTISTAATVGRVAVSASRFGKETALRISKTGYLPLENLMVPLDSSQTTLVQAKLLKNGYTSRVLPFISYIKPYAGQEGVALSEPIEIGFGQPMNKQSIFDSFELVIFNKNTNDIMGISGADMARYFYIEWKDSYTLALTLRSGFEPGTSYAININRWQAYTADGRALRDYVGLAREFTTVR
jgi:hypothetical protein